MPTKEPTPSSKMDIGDKLDVIIEHLENIDKRDKHRMRAHYIRTFLTLISTGVFLWSMWYFATHLDEIVRSMTEQTTRMMIENSQSGSEAMMEQLKGFFTQ